MRSSWLICHGWIYWWGFMVGNVDISLRTTKGLLTVVLDWDFGVWVFLVFTCLHPVNQEQLNRLWCLFHFVLTWKNCDMHIQTILCSWRPACFLRRSLTVRHLLLIAIFVGSSLIISVSSPAEDVWTEFSARSGMTTYFSSIQVAQAVGCSGVLRSSTSSSVESDHRYQMKARDFQGILVIVKQYYWHRCSMDYIVSLNTAGRDDLLFPDGTE